MLAQLRNLVEQGFSFEGYRHACPFQVKSLASHWAAFLKDEEEDFAAPAGDG